MKLQLDTNTKTIRLEETVNLGDLQDMLGKILPNNEWRQYKLEMAVIKEWSNPVIIERYRDRPFYPWWQTSLAQPLLQSPKRPLSDGVYCLSLKN